MAKEVEIAIIGAGTSGLYALSQIRKNSEDFLLINGGEHGTTCARVGCMPSKALIQIAEYYHSRNYFAESGIEGGDGLKVDISKVLKKVRSLRDRFVGSLIKSNIEPLGERSIDGYAKFISPNEIEVNGERIRAKKFIIATGSRPFIPKSWEKFRDKIVTTDELFELEDLPKRIAVVGLGVIGLEIGQALSRLGVKVVGVNRGRRVGGLEHCEVLSKAREIFEEEFEICYGDSVELEESKNGVGILVDEKRVEVDMVLASVGRIPNIDSLGLENLGVKLDKSLLPSFDRNTMQIEDLPIFIAGDVNKERQILHEAADEGRIAGYNSVNEIAKFKRKTPLGVVFCDPNIAVVGERWSDLKDRDDIVVGSFDYAYLGRTIVMNSAKGVLKIFAQKDSGEILGSEMIAARAEHIATHIAWAIEEKRTVFDLVKMPFYHPVVEEGLLGALNDILPSLKPKNQKIKESKEL